MGKVAVTEGPKLRRSAQTVQNSPITKPRGNRNVSKNNAINRMAFSQRWLEDNDKERKPFSDELFNTIFSKENIEKLVGVVKNATQTEVNQSRRLLADDYIYSIQITSQRVPHVPVHLSRILLPHSIENEEADVCLFVRDLKRGRKLDFEPTIKHYDQLLQKKKVAKPITIIPVNQLYNEFASFELRRKLTFMYDRFLVDKAVATHVNGFLGNKLLLKGRSAIPIDIDSDNLPDEIDQSLRKVFYKHINNGIVQMVQVGRESMTNQQIAENIIELLKQLGSLHPGGTNNIFKLHLKPNVNISVSVPLYINTEKAENLRPASVAPNAPNPDGLTKVRIPGSSIVGDNIVASDDDTEPKPKPELTKPAANAPKIDESQIQSLIMSSLKKIAASDGPPPPKKPAPNTGNIGPKPPRIQTSRVRFANILANATSNRPQPMGNRNEGGGNRQSFGSLKRNSMGGSGANMSDFRMNFGGNSDNNMGSNMGNNMGGNSSFGGGSRGNSNNAMRGMLSTSTDFAGIGMRRSNMMGQGSNSNSMGSSGRSFDNNSGMGMSGPNFNSGNWGNSNNGGGGNGGGGNGGGSNGGGGNGGAGNGGGGYNKWTANRF